MNGSTRRRTRICLLLLLLLTACGSAATTTVRPTATAQPFTLDDLPGVYARRELGAWVRLVRVLKPGDGSFHTEQYQAEHWILDGPRAPINDGMWQELFGANWRAAEPVGVGHQYFIVMHVRPGTALHGVVTHTGYLVLRDGGPVEVQRQ